MEQSPLVNLTLPQLIKKILQFHGNPNAHGRIHQIPPLHTILTQIKPPAQSYFSRICPSSNF
jgi:hypothetical protein